MPFSNVFRIVSKALKSATKRPLQRFNIYNRSKKYLGEDSKYFFPAPRAIGPVSKIGPSQYPHLEGGLGNFKSVKQRRLEAIAKSNSTLSTSQMKKDVSLVIDTAQKLPVIKTIVKKSPQTSVEQEVQSTDLIHSNKKPPRPLPKAVNLNLQDQTVIWSIDRVPPGRLDLNKLQEIMVNKLADDEYWTPSMIAKTYDIKEKYAENLIHYLKQIRVVISPRMKKILDYTNRTNDAYNATKDTIYLVDPRLRTELDRSVDKTFLPEDELDDNIRQLLNASQEYELEVTSKKLLPPKKKKSTPKITGT